MAGRKKAEGDGKAKQGKSGQRAYANAEELQAAVDKYFAHIEETGELVGEEGLAFHLGVSIRTLEYWYDGEKCPDLQETVEMAYTRMQYLAHIDPRYQGKAMVSRYSHLKKQKRWGGWVDRAEVKQEISANITWGQNADKSCWE